MLLILFFCFFTVFAEPIMTNTLLDLKLSLYPEITEKDGFIVFWTNKGKVERWGVTTEAGKNYEMPTKRQDVIKVDGVIKYQVRSSVPKDVFIKIFKNDLPKSVSFKISSFANGQYATIELPEFIRNYFKKTIDNFRKKKEIKFPIGAKETKSFLIPSFFYRYLTNKSFLQLKWRSVSAGREVRTIKIICR